MNMNFLDMPLEERDRLLDERLSGKHRKRIPHYHSDYKAAWALMQAIAALPATPFTNVVKQRQFLRMLGLGLCDNPSYFAATIAQLAALTPERIGTAALYVFGREEQ